MVSLRGLRNEMTVRKGRVAIVTVNARNPQGLNVLSPAPYTLKSYANWRLHSEQLSLDAIDVFIFHYADNLDENITEIIEGNYDVVAFSVYIWNYSKLIKFGETVKAAQPDVLLVFGGPHVSPDAEACITTHDFIDVIPYVTTPGEPIFYDILKEVFFGTGDVSLVNNIFYRTKGREVAKTPQLVPEMDFDVVPSPYLDGTITIPTTASQNHMIVIEASRGCPFDCGYCFWGSGQIKVKHLPLDRTLREIDVIYANPTVKYVYFADADILMKKGAEKIVNKLLAIGGSHVETFFEINSKGISVARRDLILALAKLPGFYFNLAVQSSNADALASIGAGRIGIEDFRSKVALLREWMPEAKISIDVMIPLPGDSLRGFRGTLNDVLDIGVYRFNLAHPIYLLPGTRYYNERYELGIIFTPDPPFAIVETPTFPLADVHAALRLAYWMHVITYYHPALARAFWAACDSNASEAKVDRLERWVNAIESRIHLLDGLTSLDINSVNSLEQVGLVKSKFLADSCLPRNSQLIFEVVSDLEAQLPAVVTELQFGADVFAAMDAGSVAAADPYATLRAEYERSGQLTATLRQFPASAVIALLPLFKFYRA